MRWLLILCLTLFSTFSALAATAPLPMSARPDTGLVKTMLVAALNHFEQLASEDGFPLPAPTTTINGIKAWSSYGATSLMLAKRFPTRLKRSGVVSVTAYAIVKDSDWVSPNTFSFWDDPTLKYPCGASLSLVYADGSFTNAYFRRGLSAYLSTQAAYDQQGPKKVLSPGHTEILLVDARD